MPSQCLSPDITQNTSRKDIYHARHTPICLSRFKHRKSKWPIDYRCWKLILRPLRRGHRKISGWICDASSFIRHILYSGKFWCDDIIIDIVTLIYSFDWLLPCCWDIYERFLVSFHLNWAAAIFSHFSFIFFSMPRRISCKYFGAYFHNTMPGLPRQTVSFWLHRRFSAHRSFGSPHFSFTDAAASPLLSVPQFAWAMMPRRFTLAPQLLFRHLRVIPPPIKRVTFLYVGYHTARGALQEMKFSTWIVKLHGYEHTAFRILGNVYDDGSQSFSANITL